jgi:predicted outer membrane repeat protein
MRALLRRAAVAACTGVVLLGAAVWAAGPAAAIPGPVVLYAYAAGAAVSPTSCPQDTTGTPANECSLAQALSLATPGSTINLATPGGTAHYVGNWTISTSGTTATTPVTIEPAPGLASQPVLDGGGSSGPGGPVLTVQAGQFVALSGITITNADDTGGSEGGGLENGGTVTITGSTFTGNTAFEGGAIYSAGLLLGAPGR